MNFTGDAADVNTALDGLIYTPDGTSVDQVTLNMSLDPDTQSTNSSIPAMFSPELGNGITVVDPTASGSELQVTLTTTDGTLTIGATAGLEFSGDETGTNESSMTFTGTVVAINDALDGLTYTPSSDSYVGTATIAAEAYDSSATGTTTVSTSVYVEVGGPSITVPGNQWTDANTTLTLSGGAVQVGDPGGDSTELAVTITSTDGTLSLGSTSGLEFSVDTATTLIFTGTVSDINSDLSSGLSYAPSTDFLGSTLISVTADEVGYTYLQTAYGYVNVTVGGEVAAANVSATTDENMPVTIDVLDNASEVGDGTLTVYRAGDATNGTVTIVEGSPDTIVYRPTTTDFSGTDSFTYTITDGTYVSPEATVTVTVVATPTVLAVDDDATTTEDTTVTIPVMAGDTDASSIVSVTTPEDGTAVISGSSVIYTPVSGFTGPDEFSYTITDSLGNQSTASVDVGVSDPTVLTPLVAANYSVTTATGTAIPIDLLDEDSGYFGSPTSVGTPSDDDGSSVSLSGSTAEYYPPSSGFTSGTDTFTYTIQDIYGNTATGTVTVTVAPVVVQIDFNNTSDESAAFGEVGQAMPVEVTLEAPALSGSQTITIDLNGLAGARIVGSSTDTWSSGEATSWTLSLTSGGTPGEIYIVSDEASLANNDVQLTAYTGGGGIEDDAYTISTLVGRAFANMVIVSTGSGSTPGKQTGLIYNSDTPQSMLDSDFVRQRYRIPPRVWTPIWVQVIGLFPGKLLTLSVGGQSAVNGITQIWNPNFGTALAVLPGVVQKVLLSSRNFNNGIFQTDIRGWTAPLLWTTVYQTQPGFNKAGQVVNPGANAGKLQLIVSNSDGVQLSASSGFSVSAIPIKITLYVPNPRVQNGITFGPEDGVLYTDMKSFSQTVFWGITYGVQPSSDSGDDSDLDQANWTEIIRKVNPTGFFIPLTLKDSSGDFSKWNTGDSHSIFETYTLLEAALAPGGVKVEAPKQMAPLITNGNKKNGNVKTAKEDQEQFWLFADNRTGALGIPIAESGFNYHRVVTVAKGNYVFVTTTSPKKYDTQTITWATPGAVAADSPNVAVVTVGKVP